MLFDVCAYQRVELLVILHQGIILSVENIEYPLLVTVEEAVHLVVPYGMQLLATGGKLPVGSPDDIGKLRCAEFGKGVFGTFLRPRRLARGVCSRRFRQVCYQTIGTVSLKSPS